MPSHYLNQCWNILWNKLKWNFIRNSYIFVQENAFEQVRMQNGGHFVSVQLVDCQHVGCCLEQHGPVSMDFIPFCAYEYCKYLIIYPVFLNSLRPRPNRRHFADDIFKCIFENENEWISPRLSLKIVSRVRINNIPALVQIMAWRRPGYKPLSEPMVVSLLTHICATRPQWVNTVQCR